MNAEYVKRLREIAGGVRLYGAPDSDLLAQRIENLCDLIAPPTGAPAMDEAELQEFCISLSFEQDDYTVDVIRAVENRMRGLSNFVPAAVDPGLLQRDAELPLRSVGATERSLRPIRGRKAVHPRRNRHITRTCR